MYTLIHNFSQVIALLNVECVEYSNDKTIMPIGLILLIF